MAREEIFIDLGGGAPKTPIFYGKLLRPLRRPCWMACGPLTLENLQGSWGHGPVGEYGVLFLGPVTETRRRARMRFIIWVGAFALATTAEIRQIQSVMYLQADVRKQASSALGPRV